MAEKGGFSALNAVSLVLALALGLAAWKAAGLGSVAALPGSGDAAVSRPAREPFHGADRELILPPKGPCAECHGVSPHKRDARHRAFLNVHPVTMDCGVCHLSAPGLEARRFDDEGRPSAKEGRIFASRRTGEGYKPVLRPADGATLVNSGPGCRDCHRRGGQLVSTPGLFDEYRKRLLEDLSVLVLMENGG